MKTTKKAFFKLLQKAATQVAPSTVPKTEAIKRHMDACRSLLDVPDYDVLYVAIEALKARAEATLKERDSWRESWQKEKACAETAESLLKHIAHTYCGIDIGGETTLDMVPAFVEGQIDKQSDRADAAERQFSPPAWGWSDGRAHRSATRAVLPTRVGMVRRAG